MKMSDEVIKVFTPYYQGILQKSDSDLLSHIRRDSRMVDRLKSYVDIKPSSKILELACGSGALSNLLAQEGHCVHGVDLVPVAIDVAKRTNDLMGGDSSFGVGDIRDLNHYPDSMDLILLWDVIFPCFLEDESNMAVIENISNSLSPDGVAFLEVYNFEYALKNGIEKALLFDEKTGTFKSHNRNVKLYKHNQIVEMFSKFGLVANRVGGWKGKGSFEQRSSSDPADIYIISK